MGMAENTRERGREQAGMTREGRRTMKKVLENTVRDRCVKLLSESVRLGGVSDCVKLLPVYQICRLWCARLFSAGCSV